MTQPPDNAQLLAWLQDAENDLGDLAEIVHALAARGGQVELARRAEQIQHKWNFRRNRREVAKEGE